MSADGLNAPILIAHRDYLMRRLGMMMDELLIVANRCDLTLHQLPDDHRAKVREENDRVKALLSAWHASHPEGGPAL